MNIQLLLSSHLRRLHEGLLSQLTLRSVQMVVTETLVVPKSKMIVASEYIISPERLHRFKK